MRARRIEHSHSVAARHCGAGIEHRLHAHCGCVTCVQACTHTVAALMSRRSSIGPTAVARARTRNSRRVAACAPLSLCIRDIVHTIFCNRLPPPERTHAVSRHAGRPFRRAQAYPHASGRASGACLHAYVHACMRMRIQVCVRMCMRACVCLRTKHKAPCAPVK